jgi:hypothetical protein
LDISVSMEKSLDMRDVMLYNDSYIFYKAS